MSSHQREALIALPSYKRSHSLCELPNRESVYLADFPLDYP
jgi:hypothetical protein